MPVDPTVVIVFGTLFLSLVVSLIFWLQSVKYKASKGGEAADQSIRVSELEEMIREAVVVATRPLNKQLATLEAEVQMLHAALGDEAEGLLPEGRPAPLLALPEDETGKEMTGAARRRVR